MAAASLPHVLRRLTPDMVWGHSHVHDSDELYFLGDYESGAGYTAGKVNNLISNLKKKPTVRETAQWQYKDAAIAKSAAAITATCQDFQNHIWVPVPPSKTRNDPLYDDRLMQILLKTPMRRQDIRELITQKTSTEACHISGGHRPTIDELVANYDFDRSLLHAENSHFVIFDDVLTTGCHFRACERLIHGWKPSAVIVGIFLVKVKRESPFTTEDIEGSFLA